MTATERQRRWREGKRLAQAAEPKPEPKPEPAPKPHPVDPVVIRPARAGDYGQYAPIIRQVLDFVDARPQPQVRLFELIQRLQREYGQRQARP
jgi:hypothetical protein